MRSRPALQAALVVEGAEPTPVLELVRALPGAEHDVVIVQTGWRRPGDKRWSRSCVR
jgi:hypothetical protein